MNKREKYIRFMRKIEKARNVLENLLIELYAELSVDDDKEGKKHAFRSVMTAKEAAGFASGAAISALHEIAEYLKGLRK